MRIHHLNCASLCPVGGHLIDRITPGVKEAHLVCHCLLIETNQGLVLVDTGLGMKDIFDPQHRFSNYLRHLVRPKLLANETAARQIRAMGYRPTDVRHIICTHLDFDHVGGIDDFPNAEVHVMENELTAALNPKTFIARQRYSSDQLTHSKFWNKYYAEGEKWFGFEAVRQLKGLPPEILLIPLAGHSDGHAGVAVNTDQGWLLHAGDAYFFRGELNHDYSCPAGLRAFQRMMQSNRKMKMLNQLRLKDLAHDHPDEVRIFCAHDAIELEDLKNESSRLLAGTDEEFRNVLWMRREEKGHLSLH